MWAAPDAVADVLADGVQVERIPRLDQFLGHELSSAASILLPVREAGVQPVVLLVHEEREDVDIVLALKIGRDFGAGDQVDAELLRLRARLWQSLQRIVVRQREGFDSGVPHLPDQPGRRVQSVGDRRMAMQVDPHRPAILTPQSGAGPVPDSQLLTLDSRLLSTIPAWTAGRSQACWERLPRCWSSPARISSRYAPTRPERVRLCPSRGIWRPPSRAGSCSRSRGSERASSPTSKPS